MSHSPSLCPCGLHGMQQAAAAGSCTVTMSVSLHEKGDQAKAGELRHNIHHCPDRAGGMQQVKPQLPPWTVCNK